MTVSHPIDRLAELALGEPDAGATAHVESCPSCAAELAALREAMTALPVGLPAPSTSIDVRARMLGSVDHLERFSDRAPALAELFGLSKNEARLTLHALSDDDGWMAAPFEGIAWRFVRIGKSRRPGSGMLARLAPGATFPRHKHVGDEHVLVLDGELIEPDAVTTTGGVVSREAGSVHTIGARVGGPGCVCALLNLGPIELLE
jgi:hypothetical protein